MSTAKNDSLAARGATGSLARMVQAAVFAALAATCARAQEATHEHHMHHMPDPSQDSDGATQSEREHVPPDPPSTPAMPPMSYQEMVRVMEMDDTSRVAKIVVDRIEWRDTEGDGTLAWNAHAWYGGDYNKVFLKAEGERRGGTTEDARTELLWDHVISRWWSVQAGARHDSAVSAPDGAAPINSGSPSSPSIGPGGAFRGESRDWAAIGVQGLAPYFFEIEATAYVGDGGRTAARLSAEYDMRFTQRLILQPEAELNLYGKDDIANGIGSGVSDVELALRLRYEFRREIAPYIGVVWSKQFGHTADFARAIGEDADDVEVLAGLRVWF